MPKGLAHPHHQKYNNSASPAMLRMIETVHATDQQGLQYSPMTHTQMPDDLKLSVEGKRARDQDAVWLPYAYTSESMPAVQEDKAHDRHGQALRC
jgi:hypothetical protein